MSTLDELEQRIASKSARIGVMGLGYVGLPLAVEFARAGFSVKGFDQDTEKIRCLEKRESYIEDVPSSDLESVFAAGNFSATASFAELADMDVINVCVPIQTFHSSFKRWNRSVSINARGN